MKKLPILIPVFIAGFFILTGQDFKNNSEVKWNNTPYTRVIPSGEYSGLPSNQEMKFSNETRVILTPHERILINPNFMVHPSLGSQTEVPVSRHPTNPNIMFASANTFRGGTSFSVGVYVTTDGGVTWFGSDTLNNGQFNYGDPAPAVDKDGRFVISFISLAGSIAASYSTDNGINWSTQFALPGSTTSSDKNLSATDDSPISPYYGRYYTVYTEFAGSYTNRIVMSTSTNAGVTWNTVAPVSPLPVSQRFHQGADVTVGPNGEVYVVWANNISNGANSTEDSLGFAKSTDGGASWVISRSNAVNMNGIRNSGQTFMNGIRANGFPRIAVDRTNGNRRGWIYVVSSEKFVSPATDESDVTMMRSTDGGLTWSHTRVNQDTPGNGKFQYMSAVNVDDNGGVNVIYYDTRNTPTNDSAEVFIARSRDGGETWIDMLVSDHKFKPKSIPGLAGGYQGDYIGITSGNNKLWPFWCDDISGIYQVWTVEVNISTYPLNTFNLVSPAAGSTIVSYPNSLNNYTIRWDTSASTASYKWIFGNPTTTPRRITLPSVINSVSFTAGELDNILAGLGVAVGDSLVGQWDVWAFRNNLSNDSLKAANGPRGLTLKRGVPPLTSFNLYSPASGYRLETSPFNFQNETFRWATSGPGTTYKWKFGSPSISVVRLIRTSNISGIDSSFTIPNYELDDLMNYIGVNPGDSITGQWSVWAYNGFDSAKASQDYTITFKRKGKGDILVLYDSTNANCRISRDSVVNNLTGLGITYDLFNRKGPTATDAITFKGYKRVMLLGEGSSVLSNKIKDSLKTYLASGTTVNKAKLIIISEDAGYQIDRPASLYFDSAFARSMCGFQYVADRPGVGGRGIIGVTINSGLPDSTYGPSSDVIKRSESVPSTQTYNLYRYRLFADSMNAIGRLSPTYNVAVMALDAESIRYTPEYPNPNAVKRILNGLIKFVDEIPTSDEGGNLTGIPETFSLSQNFPNPFNPSTKISFSIPVKELVTLKVYDILGKEVMTLLNAENEPGKYEIEFNASSISSGMYFYRLTAGKFTDTKRMLLLK